MNTQLFGVLNFTIMGKCGCGAEGSAGCDPIGWLDRLRWGSAVWGPALESNAEPVSSPANRTYPPERMRR